MKTYILPPGFYEHGAIVFELDGEYVVMTLLNQGFANEMHSLWFTTVPTSIPLAEFIRRNEAWEYDTLGSSQTGTWSQCLASLPQTKTKVYKSRLKQNTTMLFFTERKAKSYTNKEVAAHVAGFADTVNHPDMQWDFKSKEDFLKWFNRSWKPAFDELAKRNR